MKKRRIVLFVFEFLIFFLLAIFLPTQQVVAQEQNIWDGMFQMIKPIGQAFGYQTGVPQDIRIIAATIIRIFILILTIIFFILVVYGGYTWMMAQGEEDRVNKGKGILRNGIVGIVIIFASYAITRYVLLSITCAVSSYSGWCLFFNGVTS